MGLKNLILLGIGWVFLALGAIGVVLPVWPTTPFVLVATACFSCSPKMRKKLMDMPLFGEHIRNYEDRTGLSKTTVVKSLVFLWGMLLISFLFMDSVLLRVMLFCIGTGVTLHILWMARRKTEE